MPRISTPATRHLCRPSYRFGAPVFKVSQQRHDLLFGDLDDFIFPPFGFDFDFTDLRHNDALRCGKSASFSRLPTIIYVLFAGLNDTARPPLSCDRAARCDSTTSSGYDGYVLNDVRLPLSRVDMEEPGPRADSSS